MRILIATQNYDANGNEAAIFTVRLAEGLTRAGHGVMVIAPLATGRSGRTVHNGVLIQTVSAGLPAPLAPLSLGLRSAREMAQAIEEFGS